MKRKIRFYRQRTGETCGPSCAMMMLDFYRKIEYPSPFMENRLYFLYRSRTYKGMTAAALADCLSRHGLDVRLMHSEPEYMINRGEYFENELFRAFRAEYIEKLAGCKDRVRITAGDAIDHRLIQKELEGGRLVAAECIVPLEDEERSRILRRRFKQPKPHRRHSCRHVDRKYLRIKCIVPCPEGEHPRVLHWVLFYAMEGSSFRCCDPASGRYTLTAAEVDKYTNTPIGRILVSAAGAPAYQ